jgi:BON domain
LSTARSDVSGLAANATPSCTPTLWRGRTSSSLNDLYRFRDSTTPLGEAIGKPGFRPDVDSFACRNASVPAWQSSLGVLEGETMETNRKLKIGARGAFRAVIVVALLSALPGCNRSESTPGAVAAGQDSVVQTSAPAATSAVDVAPVRAVERRTDPPKPDPDEILAAKVKSRLNEAGLFALAVDILSASGAVTLYGTVDSAEARDQAARIASSVEGVKSVANELVIVRGS